MVDAAPVDLEPGRWKVYRPVQYCVEVFADHTIEIAVEESRDRNPVRIGGRYRAVPVDGDRYQVTIDTPKLWQKQLSTCRKHWDDTRIKKRELLGVVVVEDRPSAFTLRLVDAGAQLELCAAGSECALLDKASPSGHTSALEHDPDPDRDEYDGPPPDPSEE